MLENINKQLLINFLLLIVIITFFELTDVDIFIQNFFYDFETKSWLLDKNEAITKLIFYDGIKKILIVFALILLSSLIFFRNKEIIKKNKKALFLVLLSIIFVPLMISSLKAITNTPCPCNIEHFNGKYPNIKLLDDYPKDFVQKSKAKCWPAGHASGGFALMSLFFLFKSKTNRQIALTGALLIGWSMGIYKMLIGDHFLSHTIITMILAWMIILSIEKLINIKQKAIK